MNLPEPTVERWKPLRAGLVDMFYYDVEEFHFHDGRLLLRGNNGTGKSKVLALTLPFLLDGEMSPHRVEPDGDRQKRMEWNLLLGGKHPNTERVGYTWLEFGRRAADGTTEFRTLGCGLKAVRGRGIARHWFFISSQRIGAGLSLVSPTMVPHTREKVREAIGDHGMLYDRASDYRRAVDEALFGLGEHRYEALVNLLIQLRQPQLSKRPDERLLSNALTEALPPLSRSLIATVAEAFRGLDDEREALRGFKEAEKAAKDFLGHYRRYAAIAAKRAARAPRETHSRYEQLGRDLGEAQARYDAAQARLDTARSRLKELAEERVRLDARNKALESSPEMRNAKRLEELGEDAERREKHARVKEKDAGSLAAETSRREARAESARSRAGEAGVALGAADEKARLAAADALCEEDHAGVVDRWEDDLLGARLGAQALADRQSRAVAELDRLAKEAQRAEAKLTEARKEVDRLTRELQAAAERIAAAEDAAVAEGEGLVAAYRDFLGRVIELRMARTSPNVPESGTDHALALLEAWVGTAEGVNPAAAAVDAAVRAATTELGRQEAALTADRKAAQEMAREIEEEIARLEAGGHDAPPPPYTRAPDARTGPGAPLWKVIDFADGVPEDHRAGLEAALESSGLLDAWLTPEGTLVTADDTVIRGAHPASGPSCANVLRAAIDRDDPHASTLTDEAVMAVLAAVALGERSTAGTADTRVTVDGRWANGVLRGSWHKENADYIGEGAREQARRARLARLREELAEAQTMIGKLADALAVLDRRRETLAAEHRSTPPDNALREAHVRLAGEHRRRGELEEEHTEAGRVARDREAELAEARERTAEFASDVGLPAEPERLEKVKSGISEYRLALADLWPAAEALLEARRAVKDAEQELTIVRERWEEAARDAAEAREEATSAAEGYRALMETAGAAVEELHRRLDAVRLALGECEKAERDAREAEGDARDDRGKAAGEQERLRGEIREAEAARDAAVMTFQRFAATGLLQVAAPTQEIPDTAAPWAATPAVILARGVNAELDGVDDSDGPWERVQRRVSEELTGLQEAMSRFGHDAGMVLHDGIMVVDVVFQGRKRDVPDLADALAAEIEQRARLLSAREREILENHLLNEVAGSLHELIAAAEEEVQLMNAELESRPTSTGMKLRLVWRTSRDAPDGLDGVRDKLRQTVDAWSVRDRSAVGAFLQEQIDREHAANPAAGWNEQLTRALDYRTWHAFTIQRFQDGQWRAATGPASGGERVLAASVPLFAAASAHYKSAGNPHAPRLVALDEAFAGVDDDSRAKCLGLLAHFDMDVVMTSEREWGCYPEVPGLAISQLARRDGIDAVLVTPWRWDGRERRRVQRPVPHIPEVRRPEPEPESEQAGLFG